MNVGKMFLDYFPLARCNRFLVLFREFSSVLASDFPPCCDEWFSACNDVRYVANPPGVQLPQVPPMAGWFFTVVLM